MEPAQRQGLTEPLPRIPFNAARYPDETLEVYHLRRWNETQYFKWLASPKMFWNPTNKGPYVKDEQKDRFELKIEG
jgi:hypothetical protein